MSGIKAQIILKRGKEVAVKRFHPWIFSGAIHQKKGSIEDGAVVEVFSANGDYLASGHYQNGSIAIRVLTYTQQDIDAAFYENMLREALNLRQQLGLWNSELTNVYRLVHGEGDGLPGLIIDFYNGTAVMQCHSVGMYLHRNLINEALQAVLQKSLQAVFNKSSDTLHSKDIKAEDGYLFGGAPTVDTVRENGNAFKVDWVHGQKTGFFIDQRENRALLSRYCNGKKVLNAFSYTGGFSVYALQGGAEAVHSVDSSARATALSDENAALTGLEKVHKSFTEDVLKFLKNSENVYDVMVIDPPAYAKHLNARHNAVQGYKRLNIEALKKVTAGGIVFTFSCSQVISRELFSSTIMAAAIEAGRKVQVLHHLSQPPDHPVNIFHPEGGYLKGLVLRVN